MAATADDGQTPAHPILVLQELSKSYPGSVALDRVSLEVREGEILGLAGENGAGKSTLLKIIAGVERADHGNVLLRGRKIEPATYRDATRLGISMVFQDLAMVPNLRLYENLYLTQEPFFTRYGLLDTTRMKKAATAVLREFDLRCDADSFTGDHDFSTRQMVEIAKALTVARMLGHTHPVILLDEPTTGLTGQEAETFLRRVRSLHGKATFIFVSHRLAEILDLCDRICVMKDGRVVACVGAGTLSESQLHELMVGRVRDADYYLEHQQRAELGSVVLEAIDVYRRPRVNGVSLCLHEGEILGIGGLEGSGKSELGRTLSGILPPDQGEIHVFGQPLQNKTVGEIVNLGLAYLPKDRTLEGLIKYLPVSWNITLPTLQQLEVSHLPWLDVRKEKQMAASYVHDLRIKAPSINTLAASLSGGNQQKVVLAKWLAAHSRVLILDNPTAGVDVGARVEIYSILRNLAKRGVAIMLITDDLLELIGLSTRVLIMKDGQIAHEMDATTGRKPKETQLVKYMV